MKRDECDYRSECEDGEDGEEEQGEEDKLQITAVQSGDAPEPLPLFAPSAELLFQARRPRIKSEIRPNPAKEGRGATVFLCG